MKLSVCAIYCTAWGVLDDFYTDPTDGGKVHYGPIEDKYKEALGLDERHVEQGLH